MSQRVLIVGKSESGKSTLARKLVANCGLPVFVRDPVGNPWPDATGYFTTSEELRMHLQKLGGSPCIAIIDESVDFFRVGQVENHWIFTRGRHDAMLPIAIAHRVKMIAPNVREQATDLYVFQTGKESGAILAEEYCHEELEEAHLLDQGEFMHVRWKDGKNLLTRHRLWEPKTGVKKSLDDEEKD